MAQAFLGPVLRHLRGLVEKRLKRVPITARKVVLFLAATGVVAGGMGALTRPLQAGPPAAENRARTDRHGDPLPAGAVTRLGTVRFRHGQWVRSVAFAPDGKQVASASSDGTVRLWDRVSGREVRRFTGHGDAVNFVAFTPDGKHLISASGYYADVKDASIRLWDAATGREVRRFLPQIAHQPMKALALSPDGKTLAAGLGEVIRLVEVPSGRVRGTCRMSGGKAMSVRFSPDGKRLATVFEFIGVCLFDLETTALLWQNKDQPTTHLYQSVAFSPDGKALAVSTAVEHPITLLDTATGKEVRRFQGPHPGSAPLVFSQDGKRLFSDGWGQRGIIWEVSTGKPSGALDPPLSSVIHLALSPDGKVLAEAGDRALCFWDVATGKGIPRPEGALAMINAVALSPDGRSLLTCAHFDPEASVHLWDLASGRQLAVLAGRTGVHAVAFSPDGKTVAAGAFRGTPVLADPATGRVVRTCEGKPVLVDSLAWSPDGRLLAGAGWIHPWVRLWCPATGKELGRLELPKHGGAMCLAFAPDGKYLATGGMDKAVRLWDVAARKEIRQLTGQEGSIWSLAFSPDGRSVAAVTATGQFNFSANGTDRTIRIWEVATGRPRLTMPGPPAGSYRVAWSPDGRVLATGGEDHVIRLWEVATGKERGRLEGHEGPISALAFTQDGGRLISGSSDTTVLVWDVSPGFARRPPRAADLSPAELASLWQDLGDADAEKAYRALAALTAARRQTVPLLTDRLRPVAAPDPAKLAQLLADLDSKRFAVREKAAADLERLGELAEPAMREALRGQPSPEVRRRLEKLLAKLQGPLTATEKVRAVRGVEVLEHIGAAEARQVLQQLARGASGARLTREAKAALDRLARRPPAD